MSSFIKNIPGDIPNVWGEGVLFALSGIDGQTNEKVGLTASLRKKEGSFLFELPLRRILTFSGLNEASSKKIICNDIIILNSDKGQFGITWSSWNSLTGVCPLECDVRLENENGEGAATVDDSQISYDNVAGDVLVLTRKGDRFALSYGQTVKEAMERAGEILRQDITSLFEKRLSYYKNIPEIHVQDDIRQLLNKCYSVMKVNSLAPEGPMKYPWSTPDRTPHKAMWLWDSVFHSVGMNNLDAELAWNYLKAVLSSTDTNGMISHMLNVNGYRSEITQPPILAWGVWESYKKLKDTSKLQEVIPALEGYLLWNLKNRDLNNNLLFEWLIEENENCRSGESGMDNSPRFDKALTLDSVDFSVFMALDCSYLSKILKEAGYHERSQEWLGRGRQISQKIHQNLWDEEAGFYMDRFMDGEFSSIQASSGFLPLLLDDIPPKCIEGLLKALNDPTRFSSKFPVPSVSLSDSTWSTDMWRGPTWINYNYFIIRGLLKHGQKKQADNLILKTVDTVLKYYKQCGVVFEYYDSKDYVTPTRCERKGPAKDYYDIREKVDSIRDYHWTAALTASIIIEHKNLYQKKGGSK